MRHILAIVGPTASGKSTLGIAIALQFDGEIINCDSIQLYRRLEVGTYKVPIEERQGVPHHLIDILAPTEHFTAVDFAHRAAELVQDIDSRGRLALLVGGTGFYLRALREPLFPAPPTDLHLRARLRHIQSRKDAAHLHRLLARLDPNTSKLISPNDWSRTTRALEFYFQTRHSLAQCRVVRPSPPEWSERLQVFVLEPPRAELYERINRRTESMFNQGWVREVQHLLESGVPREAKAFGAHGYRRILQHLAGDITLEEARALTARDVRHYAKRQLTWFHREPALERLLGFGDDPFIQQRALVRVHQLLTLAQSA